MNRQSIRDAMIESLAGVTPSHPARGADSGFDSGTDRLELLPETVREHLVENESLRREWRQLLRQARAIRTLGRVPVPSDLDGRVVASLQAGYRQQRATASVQALPPEPAPLEFDARIGQVAEQALHEEGLELGLLEAPASLDGLVADRVDVERGLGSDPVRPRAARGRRRTNRLAALVGLVVVTGLGVVAVLPELGPARNAGLDAVEQASFSFKVVRIDDPALADADLKDLLGGMSGGILDGREYPQ